jgi:hypothetical protein
METVGDEPSASSVECEKSADEIVDEFLRAAETSLLIAENSEKSAEEIVDEILRGDSDAIEPKSPSEGDDNSKIADGVVEDGPREDGEPEPRAVESENESRSADDIVNDILRDVGGGPDSVSVTSRSDEIIEELLRSFCLPDAELDGKGKGKEGHEASDSKVLSERTNVKHEGVATVSRSKRKSRSRSPRKSKKSCTYSRRNEISHRP